MNQFSILLISMLFLPTYNTFQFEPLPVQVKDEIIYLEGNHLRTEITLKQANKSIQICNLKKGQSYFISISKNSSCQPLIRQNGIKKGLKNIRFEAEQSCEQFTILPSSANALCEGPFRLSISSVSESDNSLLSNLSKAIIDVAPGSAETLIKDILIGGDCFEVSNVMLRGGAPNGIGKFSNGGTSIGINAGIILSTGDIDTIPGPNDTQMAGQINDVLATGESDLEMLIGGGSSVNDYAIIEFDFVPTNNMVSFRYVFASEEYCEYVGDVYNDVFGFFISGPGIAGPFADSAKNVALIPGTSTPVAINNVNWSTNPLYYVDNVPIGQDQGFDPNGCTDDELTTNPAAAPDEIQFDGFTRVLTTDTCIVVPCETYHIKLAIADVSDFIFDSAVFLEANSFNAGGDVGAGAISETTGTNVVFESCTDGKFVFNRVGGDVSLPLVVNYAVLGTAIPGIDYTTLPTSVTIPAGENMVCLPVDVINDGIVEGLESIILEIEAICRCDLSNVTLFIDDVEPLNVSLDGRVVCIGDSVVLAPSITGGASASYTFNWSNSESTPTITVSPGATTDYTVTVTDECGTEATAMATVTIIDIEVTASSSSPICEGEDLQLMSNATGGVPPYEYSWTGPNSFTSMDKDPLVLGVGPSASGIYIVMVTDSLGCTAGAEVEVIVDPAPNVTASSNSPICEGGDLQLMSSVTGGTPLYIYSWTGPNLFSSTVANPTIAGATTSDSGTYTVVVTDENGCVDSASVSVIVNLNPTIAVSNNSPFCEGMDLELMSSASGEAPAPYTYSWSGPGAFISTDPNPTIPNASSAMSGTYFVTVLDSNECMATGETEVIIYPNPTITVSSNSPICEGGDLHLMSSVIGGTPGYSFHWSGPLLFSSVDPNPTIIGATVMASGVYSVTVTDSNGCTATDSLMVTIHPNPTITASNNGPICEGEDLELMSNAMGGTPLYTYSWTGPAGFASTDANPTIANATTSASGTYIVVVTDANGCTDEASTAVLVHPNPSVLATSNSPICDGDHLYLMAEAAGGTPPYTFFWDRLSSSNATKENPKVFDATFADAGVYSVTVTDANGCTATSTTNVVVMANITDPGEIAGDEYFCGAGYDPAPITSVAPASGASPIEYFWMKHSASNNYWEIIPGATGTTYDPGVIYETTQYSRCARRVGCVMALETNIVTKTVGTEALTDIDGRTSLCVGIVGEFSVPNQPGATYSWNFGWGATPQFANTNAVSVSWNSMGVRTIQVTVTNGTCTAFNILPIFISNDPNYCSACLVSSDSGNDAALPHQLTIGDKMSPLNTNDSWFDETAITVFPNPFYERLLVKIKDYENEQIEFRITDMQGKLWQAGKLAEIGQPVEIEVSSLVPGIYLLTLDLGEDGVHYRKVLKQ